MTEKHYISVILPLKLEWEPSYYVPSEENVRIGDRVRVIFANRKYLGVVSATGITPEIDTRRVLPVLNIERDMESVFPEEIALWRQVAEYYLCSVGEVYKAAYPAEKVNIEEARAAALAKTEQRRGKIADGIRSKIDRLRLRLDKKKQLLQRAKDGTKAKAGLIEDISKINEELRLSETALETALKNISTVRCAKVPAKMPENGLTLTPVQLRALDQIKKGFEDSKPVLLNGVTGSGKTEIYMHLAKEAIAKGKNVLYLVPEIALSRQLENRLREHFGESMMTFHSGETASSRRDTADRIRRMKATEDGNYIVLGTRSSLFLPHHNLGLIIVDEEHDGSYKQESPAPRYHGRDTALMLSVLHKSAVILGSATPSLEEMYNCMIGRHLLVELHERFHGASSSDVEIIDTNAERRKNGMTGSFSRKLIAHIDKTLKDGGQVLILRSRRAWAPAMQCESCGEIQKCPHCNVSLSYHKGRNAMICHYCGYTSIYTGTCSKCKGQLKGLGAGTQKLEEEAAALFPHARIARLDSDTSQSSNIKEIIRNFEKGETDILIGTQILAKGFDFSRLSLVAVIAADTLLGIQDFRADEKAFHLLEQFRGRCGRRGSKGLFAIQTSQPEHPIYKRIAENESGALYNQLMLERKDFDFPPYSRIIEITVKDTYEDRAERMAGRLVHTLTQNIGQTITGPYPPTVDRISDSHIRKIRISLKKDRFLKAAKLRLKESVKSFEKESGYEGHIIMDVDPS